MKPNWWSVLKHGIELLATVLLGVFIAAMLASAVWMLAER